LDQCLKDPHPTGSDINRPLFLLPGVGKDEPRLVRFRAVCAPQCARTDRLRGLASGSRRASISPHRPRIVAAIDAEAPDGPIFLEGYSTGGNCLCCGDRAVGRRGTSAASVSSMRISAGLGGA
jgi:thioesterase domain-containing protein